MAFDSNSDTRSSMRMTGTFLCGEIARNQSGRLSRSIWRNSNSIFFSRSTMAARCTQGQVLKLTSRYVAMEPPMRPSRLWKYIGRRSHWERPEAPVWRAGGRMGAVRTAHAASALQQRSHHDNREQAEPHHRD